MNIFKIAYKTVRENSQSIHRGFGFKHLSDATQYYVHPNNESVERKTTLCQPIGEAVILFATMLRGIVKGNPFGDFFYSDDRETFFLDIEIPSEYRQKGVTEANVFRYRAHLIHENITVAAYDEDDRWIDGDMEHLQELYKLLPAFCVLLARETETNKDYRDMMMEFIETPAADVFVNLHEDFYQNHKNTSYELNYSDLQQVDTAVFHAFSESYRILRENKEELTRVPTDGIRRFPASDFSRQQLGLIPQLSAEFVLPRNLNSVCNALAAGDIRAVLFHGPAGTGKTISCKLVCQAVGLPLMETINCTENLDEFVLGKYIPQDRSIIFKESYVTAAIRDGGAVVFEEINFAKPQHLAFLNSLLDDNGFVRLDNGEVVHRHPNFRFFATMNIGYFGTKELNQALYNRFSAIVEVAALPDEAISRMLTARIPECAPMTDKILGVYHKIKKKIESEELDVVISPRNLENWARLAKYDGYLQAAEKTIIPIAKSDRTLENTFRGIIMLYRWH